MGGIDLNKWIKAFTYEPKIKAVRAGLCSQTLRVGRSIAIGDEILFHGWSGKPYRSSWDWRLRVRVVEVVPISFSWDAFIFEGEKLSWDNPVVNVIAERDYIKDCGLPLGVCLRNVIYTVGGSKMKKDKVFEAQIIRFTPVKTIDDYAEVLE